MTPRRWRQVTALFHAARSRDADAQRAYLDAVCVNDPSLRAEVDALLAAQTDASLLGGSPLSMTTLPELSAGTAFGPYRVDALVGVGGMGQVYRATDTRLHRAVALKLLLPGRLVEADANRFAREARALASLNHPNIAAIHGLEEAEGVQALVLEFVDGPTLADRVARGPLPLTETLAIAKQIAHALEAAHERGIIHRDLKPANVKVRDDGTVKVLDFGLARLTDPHVNSSTEPSQAPTVTNPSPMTGLGMVLGTAPYMSPEQARGLIVDKRTDIWAFGCVLFEMLTRRRAFDGRTASDTIAQILERQPDWSAVPASTPAPVVRLVRRCLEKNPLARLRDIGDALPDLVEGDSEPVSTPAASTRSKVVVTGLAIACVLLAATTTMLTWRWLAGSRGTPVSIVRFSMAPPVGTAFGSRLVSAGSSANVETTHIAVSPDGSQIAFVAVDTATRASGIWLRPISAAEARPLAGTEDAMTVFWAPDSQSIAFAAQGELKRLDLAGGGAVPLCPVPPGIPVRGTWGAGVILFSYLGSPILRVSAGGGAAATEIEADASAGETLAAFPWFLPDGRRFLYLTRDRNREGHIKLKEPGQKAVTLLSAISNPQWVDPDYLVFVREGALVAQHFDLAAGRPVGEPMSIADGIQYSRSTARATFSTSRTGTLVYQAHVDLAQLVWFDAAGHEVDRLAPQGDYLSIRLSHDGRYVAFARATPRLGSYDLWMTDLKRGGIEQQLTSDPRSEIEPIWRRDGQAIIFTAERSGPPNLFVRELGSGKDTELAAVKGGFALPLDVLPDGRIVYTQDRVLWTISESESRQPVRLIAGRALRVSPNGELAAFTADEADQPAMFVAATKSLDRKTLVATVAASPRWSSDGHEILFLAGGRLMAAPVRTTPSLEVGTPVSRFPIAGRYPWQDFDVAPDGRFLAVVPQLMANEQPLTVVLNWPAEVRR